MVGKQSTASMDIGCVRYLIAEHGIKRDIDEMISKLCSSTRELIGSLDGIRLESHTVLLDLLDYSVSREE